MVFTSRNKDKINSPISTSAKNLVSFHLGSVAIGSFLISLVTFIRAVLKYVQSQLKNEQNDITRCLIHACQCCLCCFDKFLAYITRNAYIEIGELIITFPQNFLHSLYRYIFKACFFSEMRLSATLYNDFYFVR